MARRFLDSFDRAHVGDLSPIEQMVWACHFAEALKHAEADIAWALADDHVRMLRTEAKRRSAEAERIVENAADLAPSEEP